ncbi:MAG: hypothetical protein GJ680_05060 [Alteromonadaceae bacterium]|nr:hypothetical protein [Alteromonadaceae bacterium]
MCRIFREYWAISTRNKVIDEYIKQYYRDWAGILCDKLKLVSKTEKGLSRAVSLFIPFVEGYSIAALAMPERIDVVAKDLTDALWGLLSSDA